MTENTQQALPKEPVPAAASNCAALSRTMALIGGGIWTLLVAGGASWWLSVVAASFANMLAALLACAAGWFFLLLRVAPATTVRQPEGNPLERLVSESGAYLRPQLAAIKSESDQVLVLLAHAIAQLSEGFHGMHRQTGIQRQLSLAVMSAAKEAALLPANVTEDESQHRLRLQHDQAIEKLAISAAEVDLLISAAVKGLQVNDLVSQLIGHVLQRVDAIDAVVDRLDGLALLLAAQPAVAGPHQVEAQIRLVHDSLQALVAATERPPVSQQSMREGEIELF